MHVHAHAYMHTADVQVCEELLVSAHEEDDHVWWVDVQVFVGFLLAMLMDKLISDGGRELMHG